MNEILQLGDISIELTRKAVKGEEALCDAALSCLRQIAKLVADNPEAFAED